METLKKTYKTAFGAVIATAVVVILAAAVWFTLPGNRQAPFCYTFLHNTQFGDRKVDHPINQGYPGPNGITYFLPEVPSLQTALSRQGFYIDPYEMTGGKVYAGAFFGPSTHAAVFGFQKKYGIEQSGVVDDMTIDKLASLYSCPKGPQKEATQIYIATTTPKGR